MRPEGTACFGFFEATSLRVIKSVKYHMGFVLGIFVVMSLCITCINKHTHCPAPVFSLSHSDT